MRLQIIETLDSFRQLRENHAYYVDKTQVLKEYLVDNFKTAVLFARPRRFGKTMTMTMIRDFLDIRQDSREIFEGLKIMEHQDVVERFMNRYPVVFISLKEVSGDTFDAVLENLRLTISNVCKEFGFLLESEYADANDKGVFSLLKAQEGNLANTVAALNLLTRMLHMHFRKPAFVLVDEYDVPMAKALDTPHYDQVRDMVEHMLSYVCKTNENVKAVLLSGCLYTVKNSTYTGVNNIVPYNVLSPVFASAIGFTDAEVRRILDDADFSERYGDVEEWYDGYLFGREKMYCPWDVLRYVSSIQDGSYSEAKGPESYWLNTSETVLDIIHGFLGKTSEVNESFEQLLAGNAIDCIVNENLTYHQLHERGDNIWSALLETGYLTKAVKEKMDIMPLRIPNRSIRAVFRQEVWNYFKTRVDNAFVKDLKNALWAGEAERAQSSLSQILEATLSFYHEYHEYSYHLMLDGFFTGLGYRVLSETETGYGRSDLVILDPSRTRCLILELKHVKKEAEMASALQKAQSQILRQKYESLLNYHGYTTRLRYGMAFWGKRVMIKAG